MRFLLLHTNIQEQRQIQTAALADLYISEVHPIEVGEHLIDLSRVLEDGTGGLGQVVQAGVAAQSLGEGAYAHYLKEKDGEHKEP